MTTSPDTIAESALRKIITAYGRHPPSLTRLGAFTKAARLYNDIDDKRSYVDIPDKDRQLVLNLLNRYALLIRSEEVFESKKAFYPLALLYKINKSLDRAQNITSNIPRSIDNLIMGAATSPEYTHVFDEAYREMSTSPADYPPQTMQQFLDDISFLKMDRTLLKTIFTRATQFMKPEFHYLLEKFSTFAYQYDHQSMKDDIAKYYTPSAGPDTIEEYVMMMGILGQHATKLFFNPTASYQNLANRMNSHVTLARGLCNDLTDAHLGDMLTNTRYKHSSPLLRSALISPESSVTVAIGMTRYFLERHGEKLHPLQRLIIEKSMRDLYLSSMDHNQYINRQVNLHMSDSQHEKALNTMLHETWAAWPRPRVDDIISYYESALTGKKKIRFCELIESTAPYFDLHVSYYAEQDETIRKLRRNIFKSGTIETGEDAARAHFLKQLAIHQSSYLKAAGFNTLDIQQISRTGRLFRNGEQDTTYNVDHIIDIHAGGTNTPSNLCLMPVQLNDAKNQFLLLQTRHHGEENNGFWVLTLRPKQVREGVYTPVLVSLPTEKTGKQPCPEPKP